MKKQPCTKDRSTRKVPVSQELVDRTIAYLNSHASTCISCIYKSSASCISCPSYGAARLYQAWMSITQKPQIKVPLEDVLSWREKLVLQYILKVDVLRRIGGVPGLFPYEKTRACNSLMAKGILVAVVDCGKQSFIITAKQKDAVIKAVGNRIDKANPKKDKQT